MIYRLNELSVVDVTGRDADKILHNVTTNHVRELDVATGCETFITEVRGKMLGHVLAYRTDAGYRLIGAPGQSERIVAHIDRYTIREDAHPSVQDDRWCGLVVDGESLSKLGWSVSSGREKPAYRQQQVEVAGHAIEAYVVPWLGAESVVLLVPRELADQVSAALASEALVSESQVSESQERGAARVLGEVEFHRRRTLAAFPWFGIDLDENLLPQEANRDAETICFTKGCYLGQETIARLDALGQVQKKLVRWSLDAVATAGTTLNVDGKPVARLTSIAAVDEAGRGEELAVDCGPYVALAMTRRSHFERGATAAGAEAVASDDESSLVRGTVL